MDDHPLFLVEDDNDARAALGLLLRTIGYQVLEFGSAAEFLMRLRPDDKGCVVTDVHMAGISGLQLLEQLQHRTRQLPTIVVSGHGDVADCRRAFKAGAVDFLMKPLDQNALIEAVHSAMARLQAVGRARPPVVCDGVRLEQLTARENEVIDLIAEGLSTKEIARRLNLSPRTVEKHRAGIALKVGTASVAQLVRLVLGSPREGLSRTSLAAKG
jgi:FixJ family two-component response regulator